MPDIHQLPFAIALYVVALVITVPILWGLSRLLRCTRSRYTSVVTTFSWGMVMCVLAAFVNTFLLVYFDQMIRSHFMVTVEQKLELVFLQNLFVIAPVEEGLKAIAFLATAYMMMPVIRDRSFKLSTPIFWAALIGGGFAAFENVVYALRIHPAQALVYEKAGINPGLAVVGLRTITSSLTHIAATSMLGIAVALHMKYGTRRALTFTAGYLMAIILHVSWNVLVSIELRSHFDLLLSQGILSVLFLSLVPLLAFKLNLIHGQPLYTTAPGEEVVPHLMAGGPAPVNKPEPESADVQNQPDKPQTSQETP